jgi:intracellular sulfur oxidation DsrE/DsrF family protein
MKSYKLFGTALVMFALGVSPYSYADSDHSNNDVHASNIACPVGLVRGLSLTDEFGAVVAANTRCLKVRHNVKTLFAIDQFETSPGSPYALNQMQNVYNDYTITNGMTPGKDFKMVAIVHSKGGMLLLNDPTINPYIDKVKNLMAEGVTFYFCENTVRGFIHAGLLTQGDVAAGVIPGVKYVTAGLSAISDFQAIGYQYDMP